MATVQSNLPANQSNPSPIEVADAAQRRLFILSVGFGVLAALVGAILALLLWRANNTHQAAVKADADARIAEARERASNADARAGEANERAEKLENDNLTLRGQVATLENQAAEASKDLARLQKDAADAKAAQQRVEIELTNAIAQQQRIQIELARAQERTAIAEQELIRQQPRRLTVGQAEFVINRLKPAPKGELVILCSASSHDACSFAEQLAGVLTEAGWVITTMGEVTASPPFPEGLTLRVRSPIDPAGITLRFALTIAGFPTVELPDKNSEAPLTLMIGGKPGY